MKQVPTPIIMAAQDYDSEAVDFVFRHFEGYITSKCVNTYIDQYGGIHYFADDDLYYQAKRALFDAIAGFEFRDPPEDFVI